MALVGAAAAANSGLPARVRFKLVCFDSAAHHFESHLASPLSKSQPGFHHAKWIPCAPRAQNGDALDTPALSFGGVHQWFTQKSAGDFARLCRVGSAKKTAVEERLCRAMSETAKDVVAMSEARPAFRPVAKRMLELWAAGIQIHDAQRSTDLLSMTDKIRAG